MPIIPLLLTAVPSLIGIAEKLFPKDDAHGAIPRGPVKKKFVTALIEAGLQELEDAGKLPKWSADTDQKIALAISTCIDAAVAVAKDRGEI